MTYFWETVDTIAPGLGWPHFGPFHLAVLAVFLLLGAVLCRGYCGMDTDKRRRWRRTVALLLVVDELFKDFGLLYCSATSFLRNWDSILEKKRANLRSISEPARLRQPPPQKHGIGTRKRAGSKHTGGATNSRPPRAFCPLVG